MLSDIISTGEILEMQAIGNVPSLNEEEESRLYRTKVFDVLSEDQLEVMMPIEKGKLVLLPVNGEYDMYFYTEKGLYQCSGRVLDRYRSNNIYIVVMELTSKLKRHQRREFYRFGCALRVDSRVLEEDERESLRQGRVYLKPNLPLKPGVAVDISGGGMRFIAGFQYESGVYICCTYELNLGGKIKQYRMAGKVLSVRELTERKGTWEHRVQYVHMDADEREEIIKYIFEEERRQRRKASSR